MEEGGGIEGTSVSDLPRDLQIKILDPKDRNALRLVCRSWMVMGEDVFGIHKGRMIHACRYGDREYVISLLRTYEPDDQYFRMSINLGFRMVCADGNAEMVDLMLGDLRLDPYYSGNAPILEAYEAGHEEIVDLILRDKNRVDSAKNVRAAQFAFQVAECHYRIAGAGRRDKKRV